MRVIYHPYAYKKRIYGVFLYNKIAIAIKYEHAFAYTDKCAVMELLIYENFV